MAVTKGSKKALAVSAEIFPMVKEYYQRAHEHKAQGKPVAWCGVAVPKELLWALGIYPLYPEHYSTVCAIRKTAVEFCNYAEMAGYSRELCGYARTITGLVLAGEKAKESAPFGGMPEPDFLFITSTVCDTRLKWFEELHGHAGWPIHYLDIPEKIYAKGERYAQEAVGYYHGQLQDLVSALESQLGVRYDPERLREVMEISWQTRELDLEILELRKAVPAPMSAADGFAVMFPRMYLAGTRQSLDFHRRMRDELQEKVERGIGVVQDERFRLQWSGIPFWFNMGLINYFEEFGGVVAIDVTYTNFTRSERRYTEEPLKELAYRCTAGGLGITSLVDTNLLAAREYQSDGAVLSFSSTCRPLYIAQLEVKNRLKEAYDIPSLMLESDMADERRYDPALVQVSLESFMEVLNERLSRRSQEKLR